MEKRKKQRPLNVSGVFDLETESWDKFVLGGLQTRNGFRSYRPSEENQLVDDILKIEGDIWAHNGGRFDSLWFLEHIAKRGIKAEVVLAGSRVLAVTIGETVVRDSWAICPLSLSASRAISGVAKSETGLSCYCETGSHCGGYCSISRKMSPKLLKKLEIYLEQDCRATWALVEKLISYTAQQGFSLRQTIGASAWASAADFLGLERANFTPPEYDFLRASYFGGRVQVFRPKAGYGQRYDINSAYPAALVNTCLPDGERKMVDETAARLAYLDAKEGVFEATVSVPEMFIPPLPARAKNRVVYPYGKMSGVWTAIDLRYAENVGCKIESIKKGYVWSHSSPFLSPFCKMVWDLRAKEGPKTGFGQWLKLFANSLTGKFAQRPESETVVVNPSKIVDCPANYACGGVHSYKIRDCCEHQCTGNCGATIPVGNSTRIYATKKFKFAACGHVHWAAYLTADTRTRQLHSQLTARSDGKDVVYCDTDSCFTTTERERTGPELGEWKAEGEFFDFVAMAPKTYHYYDENGEVHAASKGIPDPARNWSRLQSGVEINRGVEGFKTAARGENMFTRKLTERRVRADGKQFGDRFLHSDGLTYPRNSDYWKHANE